jgi:hypothetical protein
LKQLGIPLVLENPFIAELAKGDAHSEREAYSFYYTDSNDEYRKFYFPIGGSVQQDESENILDDPLDLL